MNKQDLLIKIQNSAISDERKNQIAVLINNNELNPSIIDQIKDIIQMDIDENMTDILSDDQKKEIMDIENEESAGIKTVVEEIAKDLQFVEDEMTYLDTTLTSLDPAVDQMNIDSLKSDLYKASQ
jgi:predicted transcriptional regulator